MHTRQSQRSLRLLTVFTAVASAFVAPITARSETAPTYTAPDCTDMSNPLCTRADQWRVDYPEADISVDQTCTAITDVLQNKTENAKWMNANCPGPAKDATLAARLTPAQANACRLWFTAQQGTVRDMCVARDTTKKTQKNLLFLAGTNAAAALLCKLEMETMLAGAKAANAAIHGKGGSRSIAGGATKYLLGAKNKPLVCTIGAVANVAVEAFIAKQLMDINGSNYLTNGASVQGGKLNTSTFGNLENAGKSVATLAAMGINLTALGTAVSVLTKRGLCTNADLDALKREGDANMMKGNGQLGTRFEGALLVNTNSATYKRCKDITDVSTTFDTSTGDRNIARANGPRPPIQRRIASESPLDAVRRSYEITADDLTFINLLIASGEKPDPMGLGSDPYSLELYRLVVEQLAAEAGV